MLRNFLLISTLFFCLIIFSAFSSNPCSQLGDANCDCIVNLSDLTLVINNWLQVTAVGNNGDVVGSEDGFVNLDDLTLVINNWLEVTPNLIGCTDSTALNYDSLATVDNGECFSCVDSLLQNDTVININDSINLFDINLFISGIGVYDIDSNFYPSVAINDQEWTIENLKTTRFSNGDLIPNVTDGTIWQSLTTEAWCYWGNSIGNNATYGKLYNWYTVSGSRNLCPINWRIPTKSDIDTLINFSQDPTTAGGALKESGYSHWPYPNVGATNSSGFTGLPGGYRASDGNFYNIGIGYSNSNCSGDCIVNVPNRQGMYWSSDPTNNGWSNDSVYGYSINLHSQLAQLSGTVQSKVNGVSVRCVRSLPKFLWSTGDTTSSIRVSPNQTTTFWLIKTENGISCIDSVTITVLISGCTDSTATNFDPIANTDDGSCVGIGDFFEGGVVFWLDGNGGGLIAAPYDQKSCRMGVYWD